MLPGGVGGMLLFATLVGSLKEKIAMLSNATSKNEISKALFDWSLENKEELLGFYIDNFDKMIEKLIEEFKNKKKINVFSDDLLNIVDKIKKEEIETTKFIFKISDLLCLLKDKELKQFAKEANEYLLSNEIQN